MTRSGVRFPSAPRNESDRGPSPTGPCRVQLHTAKGDGWGDFDDAQELAIEVPDAELLAYDTTVHLVADSSVPDHDPRIAAQILEHTLTFLERW